MKHLFHVKLLEVKEVGNKTEGRKIANSNNIDYMFLHGSNITNNKNTGISFTNSEVVKYYNLLTEYALNRIKWTSDTIPEQELRLIEWNIFHYGKCVMLDPKIIRDNVKFRLGKPRIYQCNYTRVNTRSGEPLSISIFGNQNSEAIIDLNYDSSEFTVFTNNYSFSENAQPFCYIAWEFACKLHELDLAFNANSHRNRMPFVFGNSGAKLKENENTSFNAFKTMSIAEIMRSAYGRNEQFVEISDDLISKNGFMHEPRYVKNDMLEHIEAQKKLYQAYFELLGLYTNKEKGGVYTVKKLQENGDETGDYITDILKNTRLLCAKRACQKFGINLTMEVV